MRSFFSAAALLAGCSGGAAVDTTDTSETHLELFCEDIVEADAYTLRDGDGEGVNGSLYGRIITDEADDPHNPNFVAKVAYILENLDVGGSPRYGESSNVGEIVATLGAGQWRIQLSNNRVAGYDCYNDQTFVIEAGQITELCLDVACE
jgi:hypothetical protein